jgi:serine/threonine protein phosphatase PrpC
MPIKAEVIEGKPRLPRVSRRSANSRVYDTDTGSRWSRRTIGTVEQTDAGTVAHVVVPLVGADGKRTNRLVQLTADPDTLQEVVVAEMRRLQASLPPVEPKVAELKRGKFPWSKEIGKVRTVEGLVVRDEVLQREARVRGTVLDQTLARQRRPAGHDIVVHRYDGTSTPPTGSQDIAAADVESQIRDISDREYRVSRTRTDLVRDGERVVGKIVYGHESWNSNERGRRRKNERGVVVGYTVDNEGHYVPLTDEQDVHRIQIRNNDHGRRRRKKSVRSDAQEAVMSLDTRIRALAPERVEAPQEIIQAGAMHQGERKYQQDSYGINGSLHLGDIGGKEANEEQRIAALAEALVGRDADQNIKDGKIAEIKSLSQEVAVLISEGKLNAMGVVVDGMGGAVDGQIASAIALYVFQREMVNSLQASKTVNIEQAAKAAAETANKAVFDYGSTVEVPEGKFPPQTGFAAYVIGPNNNVTFLKDADCRIYLEQGNNMTRVFADNSFVEMLLDSGNINPSEVFGHPRANLVTHSFGGDETLGDALQVGTLSLPQGGRILLATDGVWGDFDRNTDRNQRILTEADVTRNQRVAAWTGREGGREYATDLAFGEIFQRIILRIAPEEPQELANYLVDRPDRHIPLGGLKLHDNAAAVVAEVPALVAA